MTREKEEEETVLGSDTVQYYEFGERNREHIQKLWIMDSKLRQLMWNLEDRDRIQNSLKPKGR